MPWAPVDGFEPVLRCQRTRKVQMLGSSQKGQVRRACATCPQGNVGSQSRRPIEQIVYLQILVM
ncbi:hypothetical protein Dda_5314 [Drechslerella dactyloides]|uniref:Uncharacterized protein n=1 Tax=Drechslerella dactyloides TaxID=74499 RepID=A0AAD6NHF2_DREDA|nr:hypothetical protein Dda_5314 [Drechslerella dactyloides]